jgi:hypothetical protein
MRVIQGDSVRFGFHVCMTNVKVESEMGRNCKIAKIMARWHSILTSVSIVIHVVSAV